MATDAVEVTPGVDEKIPGTSPPPAEPGAAAADDESEILLEPSDDAPAPGSPAPGSTLEFREKHLGQRTSAKSQPGAAAAPGASHPSAAAAAAAASECPVTGADCCKCGPVSMAIHDLCLWKRPMHSGLVLTLILASWYLVTWCNWTVLSLLCTYELVVLVFAVVYCSLATLVSRGAENVAPRTLSSTEEFVTAAQIEQAAPMIAGTINAAGRTLRDLLYCKSTTITLRVCLALFIASHVTNWLSAATVFMLLSVGALSVPILYAKNRVVADQTAEQLASAAGHAAKQALTTIDQKVGKHLSPAMRKKMDRWSKKLA